MPVEEQILKTDLVKLSGGNISENFIRPYCLCETPRLALFARPADSQTPIPEEAYRREQEQKIAESLQKSEAERQNRLAVAPIYPLSEQVQRTEYRRNPDVVASVLFRAAGRCELCGANAPFFRISDGSPYLEIHHILSLAEGGEDTIRNAVSLCPNCHKEVHYGKERDRHNKELQRITEKLVPANVRAYSRNGKNSTLRS